MKQKTAKLIRAVIVGMFIIFFAGLPLAYIMILASMGLTPIYVTKVLPTVFAALLLALILSMIDYLSPKWIKRVWLVFLCVCVGAGVYICGGAYRESLATVDDRDLMLEAYEPFNADTKAVSLDMPSTLKFDEADARRIRIDGATALYPVYAAFVQAVYPEGEYPVHGKSGHGSVVCTNTVNAYERLIERQTDIIFAAAPSQEQLDMAKEAGVQLHLTPIGREAFVFFVNSKNPVTGLTVEQIQGIYTGEITNWREVGGPNRTIRPFQRAKNSGSQSALEKLMEGLPLTEPETEDRIASMGGIITEVASYRNYKNAIGFSFRFYASEMDTSDEIRLLSLNGVEPTRENIANGSYPVSSCFYAVTASGIGQDAPEKHDRDMAAFIDWILSEQGQEIIEKTGYVGL